MSFLAKGGIPAARRAVQLIWSAVAPDYSKVGDSAAAGRALTGLLNAAHDIVAYRQLSIKAESIHLVSGDRMSYLKFAVATDRTADNAVSLSHLLALNAEEARGLGDLIGGKAPFRSLRIVILSLEGDFAITRLDLDPESPGGVSWYGPFDRKLFNDIALGFALFVTHMVANVFDDDDGEETFAESIEWIT
ncbi:hypothetical protein [Cryobacterium sp. Y50]|uniref:hypothetical protein n=1 Tax=Cryobacterium sp. Y50 TaxID=2048286 RepID=UPI0011B042CD|nr:hypothetical protein [Cryobacterium sp. Y50]